VVSRPCLTWQCSDAIRPADSVRARGLGSVQGHAGYVHRAIVENRNRTARKFSPSRTTLRSLRSMYGYGGCPASDCKLNCSTCQRTSTCSCVVPCTRLVGYSPNPLAQLRIQIVQAFGFAPLQATQKVPSHVLHARFHFPFRLCAIPPAQPRWLSYMGRDNYYRRTNHQFERWC
jgi:hypothetical protein